MEKEKRFQGSIEYLILIAGVIVVAIVIAGLLKVGVIAPTQGQATDRGNQLQNQFEITCNPLKTENACNNKSECAWSDPDEKCLGIAKFSCEKIPILNNKCANQVERCHAEGPADDPTLQTCVEGNSCEVGLDLSGYTASECISQDTIDGSRDCYFDFSKQRCLPKSLINGDITRFCLSMNEANCNHPLIGDFDGDATGDCSFDADLEQCVPAIEPACNTFDVDDCPQPRCTALGGNCINPEDLLN